MNEKSMQAIIEDIKRVADCLGARSLARSEYLAHGNYSAYQVYDDGMTWTELCERAGLGAKTKQPVSDATYFANLAEAVKTLGRYPRVNERKKFSLNFSKRRYPTLTEFIDKAIELGHVPDLRQAKLPPRGERGHTPETVGIIRSALHNQGEQSRPVPPIPLNTKRSRWERTGIFGFPYAPQEEQGVLALFSILCAKGILPWEILDLSTNGIDATCFDHRESREIHVELKHLLTKGSWNHKFEDLDYVVCWENRWPDFPKPVIELSKLIRETHNIHHGTQLGEPRRT